MKKYIFFGTAIISLSVFVSCSHNQSSEILYLNEDTLQAVTSTKESELQWTRELESARLLRDISKNEAVSSNIKLTNPIMSIASPDYFGKSIYPFLPGFGSLNTSLISPELKKSLELFCKSVSEWKFSETSFDSSSLLFLALFKFDIENGWKSNFGSDFLSSVSLNTDETASEQNESVEKDDEDNPKINEQKETIFDKWVYGEPFFDESDIQIPVRFYSKQGSIDVLLYCSKETFKFNQIIIKKWNKK